MKTFVIFVCALFQVITALDVPKTFYKCLTEMSLNEDLLEHFFEKGVIPDESNKKAKCFFHCEAIKKGTATDTELLDVDTITAQFVKAMPVAGKETIGPMVKSCYQRNETDMCEKSYAFAVCIRKQFTVFDPKDKK